MALVRAPRCSWPVWAASAPPQGLYSAWFLELFMLFLQSSQGSRVQSPHRPPPPRTPFTSSIKQPSWGEYVSAGFLVVLF